MCLCIQDRKRSSLSRIRLGHGESTKAMKLMAAIFRSFVSSSFRLTSYLKCPIRCLLHPILGELKMEFSDWSQGTGLRNCFSAHMSWISLNDRSSSLSQVAGITVNSCFISVSSSPFPFYIIVLLFLFLFFLFLFFLWMVLEIERKAFIVYYTPKYFRKKILLLF